MPAATGHAFALWQLRQFKEAVALVDGLPDPEKMFPPGRAPYLAVIYASAGRPDEAQAALRRAPASQTMLPEENALLTEAAAAIARSVRAN